MDLVRRSAWGVTAGLTLSSLLSPPSAAAQRAGAGVVEGRDEIIEGGVASEPEEGSRGAPEPSSPHVAATLMGGGILAAGMVPGVAAAGATASVGLRIDDWSVLITASFEHSFLQVLEASGDQLAARLMSAGPDGCFHFDPGLACLGVQFASLQARRQNRDFVAQSTFMVTADARGGVELVEGIFMLRVLADLRVHLMSFDMTIDGANVWSMPPVSGALRLLIGAFID